MTTAAQAAFGTTFQWNSQTVAELTNIGGYELSIDTIDVTNHQSTSGFKEFIAGLVEVGEVSIEGNFKYSDTNGQIAMLTDAAAKTSRTVTVTFPSSLGILSGTAYITKIKVGEAAFDGKIPFSASIKITGVPTFTTTASTGLTTPFFSVSGAGTVIVPTAAGDVYDYVVNIGTAIETVTITPTASAGTITITANSATQTVVSGNASTAITLGAAGSIVEAVIKVEETGKTPKEYTLQLTRAAS